MGGGCGGEQGTGLGIRDRAVVPRKGAALLTKQRDQRRAARLNAPLCKGGALQRRGLDRCQTVHGRLRAEAGGQGRRQGTKWIANLRGGLEGTDWSSSASPWSSRADAASVRIKCNTLFTMLPMTRSVRRREKMRSEKRAVQKSEK